MPARDEKIAVIGLGYVGLPVALAMANKYPTIGFDVSEPRIKALKAGNDQTLEVDPDVLERSKLRYTIDPTDLEECTFFIVAVPTPIDHHKRPDLGPLRSASRSVAQALRKGDVVVYESTVYPGVTEDVCGPILAEMSGLTCGEDFFIGYSPERINPGDTEHTFERIVKVVSGQDAPTLDRVAEVYGSVVTAGVHRATSIKVAEAAKVIENTQRDLNIALMNELALIFDRLGIRTHDVLEAAATKWNFLRFTPGLVGGHCIGVDPYYLTSKAEQLGYQPEVILAGRRINNGVGAFVAKSAIRLIAEREVPLRSTKVAVLGLTFKENVPDLRNSRVPDILSELSDFGVNAMVHDPLGDPHIAREEYGVELVSWDQVDNLDALILAVPHEQYVSDIDAVLSRVRDGGVVIDVKSVLSPPLPRGLTYWSL